MGGSNNEVKDIKKKQDKKEEEEETDDNDHDSTAEETTKPMTDEAEEDDNGVIIDSSAPSMSVSFFLFWVLPIFTLAFLSRFYAHVDMVPKPIFPKDHDRQHQRISIDFDKPPPSKRSSTSSSSSSSSTTKKAKMAISSSSSSSSKMTMDTSMQIMKPKKTTKPKKKMKKKPAPSPVPTYYPTAPTNYKQIVDSINQKRRRVPGASPTNTVPASAPKKSTTTTTTKPSLTKPSSSPTTTTTKPTKPTTTTPTQKQRQDQQRKQRQKRHHTHETRDRGYGASSDPVRIKLNEQIDDLREEYEDEPNVINAINLADALRRYDMQYHDGGTKQPEAIEMYEYAIQKTLKKKINLQQENKPTNFGNIPQEVQYHDYNQKSVDGTLCSLYCSQGKVYFMANMFEKAVEQYSQCIDIEPLYLDALNSRGSALIILGRYEDAANDLVITIEHDQQYMFTDAFTGLGRVLSANENALPTGWDIPIRKMEEIIPKIEGMKASAGNNANVMNVLYTTLNRLHHVMFTYHDVKTKNRELAWHHLTTSYENKMKSLPEWRKGFEKQKINQTMNIFKGGFWPDDVGSTSKVPVFIIGFVRSGSTLLERVLDSHPDIVGTGEDSVFNGRLDDIRNRIVETSMTMDNELLIDVVEELADNVVDEMRERWKVLDANTEKDSSEQGEEAAAATITKKKAWPKRMVDKMLNNYYNVGFIHMLFPNALILHVVREPMDTCFSAYKHEFPPGTLDYTSDFEVLAELYHSYRDLMDHWDRELPGRIMHIRYEDMVHDMSGVAKSIIEVTGLPWYDDILNFHTKKQAVNTLSTTQVRKGVYKHSIHSWKKYEQELQPLVKLLGKRVSYDHISTNLPGYTKPTTPTISSDA